MAAARLDNYRVERFQAAGSERSLMYPCFFGTASHGEGGVGEDIVGVGVPPAS